VSGRHVVIVIAPERFRDEELETPRRLLVQAGHRVSVASTRSGEAVGMLGVRIKVDATVAQVRAEECDALVIAGGSGAPAHLWDAEPLITLVKAVHTAGRPVGAICLGPPVLARAGILLRRRATCYPADRALLELKRGGATVVEEPVVCDGTIVTANGPEAATAFGEALAQLLSP
jgi:protease I